MKKEVYLHCKDCRHFVQHYVADGCHLLTISEGHCGFRCGCKPNAGCEHYEDNATETADALDALLKRLRDCENDIAVIRHLMKKYCEVLAVNKDDRS